MTTITSLDPDSLHSRLKTAIYESLQGNSLLLSEILHDIKSCFATSPQGLLLWLRAFIRSLQSFSYRSRPFLETLLQLPWLALDDTIARPFLSFLETLVSAEPQFSSCVINSLVSLFKCPEPHVLAIVSANAYFERIHATLKTILTTIPSGPTFALTLLEKNFPHRRLPLVQHQVYIQNLLKLLEYVPLLREGIFSLIFEKLVLMDIDIQTDLEDVDPSERNLQFFMELNGGEPSSNSSTSSSPLTSSTLTPSDSAIHLLDDSDSDSECPMNSRSATTSMTDSAEASAMKLDHSLNLLFSYFHHHLSTTHPPPHHPSTLLEETVYLCLKLFEKTMLPMFKSRYCQFLIFRLCAFDAVFADQFLGLLAKKILDVAEAPLIRINSALYMASFLARAQFLSFQEHVKPCFQLLLLFVHGFVANNEQCVKQPNVEKFGVFYAATQAVLYLFCFHWKALCDEETGFGSKGGLDGFERILLSKFNPLMVLKPALVEEFARITHALNILHCYAIIHRNQRLFLPSHAASTTTTTSSSSCSIQTLDSFFPFEPMHLPLSKHWIDPLYVEYERPCFTEPLLSLPPSSSSSSSTLPLSRPFSCSSSAFTTMDLLSRDSSSPSSPMDLPSSSLPKEIPGATNPGSFDDRVTPCGIMDYLSVSPSNTSVNVLLSQLGITSQ